MYFFKVYVVNVRCCCEANSASSSISVARCDCRATEGQHSKLSLEGAVLEGGEVAHTVISAAI